jgi:hypothetical protein
LTEFFLQRLDLLLDVGCFTELFWCCVNHSRAISNKLRNNVKPEKH